MLQVRNTLGLRVERDTRFVGDKPLSAYADSAQSASEPMSDKACDATMRRSA